MKCERCGKTEEVAEQRAGCHSLLLCVNCREDWDAELEKAFIRFGREIKSCYFCGREYGPRGSGMARESTVGGRGCVDCHNDGRG